MENMLEKDGIFCTYSALGSEDVKAVIDYIRVSKEDEPLPLTTTFETLLRAYQRQPCTFSAEAALIRFEFDGYTYEAFLKQLDPLRYQKIICMLEEEFNTRAEDTKRIMGI
ncbi:hypothetical protein AB9X29_003779 [Vibrio vulnificus]